MRLPLTAALIALTVLSACGVMRDSRLNPMNWFGRSKPAAQVQELSLIHILRSNRGG